LLICGVPASAITACLNAVVWQVDRDPPRRAKKPSCFDGAKNLGQWQTCNSPTNSTGPSRFSSLIPRIHNRIRAGLYGGSGTVSPNLRRGPSSSKGAGGFKGAASAQLRCDHCRGKLRFVEHRYWNMRFCCAACMSTYRQRLSPETQEKILALDLCGPFWKARRIAALPSCQTNCVHCLTQERPRNSGVRHVRPDVLVCVLLHGRKWSRSIPEASQAHWWPGPPH
jgi:hypothetical protein